MRASDDDSAAMLRDRLANERTLLAWIRTALAFIGLGLVVARFAWLARVAGVTEAESTEAQVVGVVLVLLGSLTAAFGAQRTRTYASIIDPNRKHPTNGGLYVAAMVVAGLGFLLGVQIAIS